MVTGSDYPRMGTGMPLLRAQPKAFQSKGFRVWITKLEERIMSQEAGNLSIEDRTTNFPKLMQELDGGVISNVIGLALSNVSRAVSYSDKQGEVKLNLKLKPMGTNNEMVEITANMSVKEPKSGFGSKSEDFQYTSIAYVGNGGKLSYDRPKEDIHGQAVIEEGQLREVRG